MGRPTDPAPSTPDPSAAILPLETESGNKLDANDTYTKQGSRRRHRRRACVIASSCCLLTLLILALVAVVLFLTLFKPKDPTTTLRSVSVDGLATGISFPAIQLRLNITLDIQIDVYNPNRATFNGRNGTTDIQYRGLLVGTADILPSVIPQMGTGTVSCRATILADAFGTQLMQLVQDALGGSLELQASSRIPGRVKFLGFIKKNAVATAHCTIVVGFPDLAVKSQKCSQKTKL